MQRDSPPTSSTQCSGRCWSNSINIKHFKNQQSSKIRKPENGKFHLHHKDYLNGCSLMRWKLSKFHMLLQMLCTDTCMTFAYQLVFNQHHQPASQSNMKRKPLNRIYIITTTYSFCSSINNIQPTKLLRNPLSVE